MQAKTGRILSTILTSSNCCTEHWRDLWGAWFITALFRNLRLLVGVSMSSVGIVLFPACSSVVVGVGGEGLVDRLAIELLWLLDLQVFSAVATRT